MWWKVYRLVSKNCFVRMSLVATQESKHFQTILPESAILVWFLSLIRALSVGSLGRGRHGYGEHYQPMRIQTEKQILQTKHVPLVKQILHAEIDPNMSCANQVQGSIVLKQAVWFWKIHLGQIKKTRNPKTLATLTSYVRGPPQHSHLVCQFTQEVAQDILTGKRFCRSHPNEDGIGGLTPIRRLYSVSTAQLRELCNYI